MDILLIRHYSLVVERQPCKLKVLGSIPSGGCILNGILCIFDALNTKATATGFEPARAEPTGFRDQLLNLSDTLSSEEELPRRPRMLNSLRDCAIFVQEILRPGIEPGTFRV
jgi:hypothetical protein